MTDARARFVAAAPALPAYVGTVWRAADFEQNWPLTLNAPLPTSRDLRVATENFRAPSAHLIVSTAGRDVSLLSAHPSEQEVVLLPGARLIPASGLHDVGGVAVQMMLEMVPPDQPLPIMPTDEEIAELVRLARAGEAVEVYSPGRFGAPKIVPTPRDTRADAAYFEGVLDLMRRHNERHDDRLNDPSAIWRKPSYRGSAAGDAMAPRWAHFSAMYSAGTSIADLRAEYELVIQAAERAVALAKETMPADTIAIRFAFGGNRDFYRQWLWLVALGIAFDVDDVTFARIVAAVEFGRGDRLIDRLIASRIPDHPISDELAFPKETAGLERVFDTRDPRALETYLAGSYSAWKGANGWGGHEFLDQNQYFGYWKFEVAGLVAALGIDDASFRDNEYYPQDLINE